MKHIEVSTDVFARIWSLRKEGEDSEDTILRRVLWQVNATSDANSMQKPKRSGGIVDHRYGVYFPEGFEIERTYLGKSYRATVREGKWIIGGHDTGYTRLNALSRAIGTKTENAWVNWFYTDEIGRRRPVSDLRNPDTISSRGSRRSNATVEGKERQISDEGIKEANGEKIRWCDDVKAALEKLGGQASLHSIYREVEELRRANGRSVPPTLDAVIRRTLEDFSSDSENFRGEDWFEMAEGKGSGVWALRRN